MVNGWPAFHAIITLAMVTNVALLWHIQEWERVLFLGLQDIAQRASLSLANLARYHNSPCYHIQGALN